MAKWNLDTIEADMAEIRECVDKLQEINTHRGAIIVDLTLEVERLREQLRQAQQSLRNARDAALEEAAQASRQVLLFANPALSPLEVVVSTIRSLKTATQGSR